MSFIPLNINNIKKRKNPKSQNLWNNTGIALALVIFAIFVISINTVQRNLDLLLDYRFRLSNRREWVWDWLCLYFWPWREYTFNHSYSLRRRSRKITDSSIIICPCAIVTLHKLFDSAIRKFPLWVSFKNFCLDFFVRSVWVLRNFKRSYETLAVHEKEKELIKQVQEFSNVIQLSAKQQSPALIANYTYDLVKLYNSFFQNVSIFGATTENEKIFRVQLSKKVGETIKIGFSLLGIQVPERM